jgi:two-component system, cell cycle sensor histidine kinase and response regulator CckA
VRASRPARILIVDDEPSVRAIARDVLTRAGFTVVLAQDGEQALECFRIEGTAIDAVLLDMTMPGLNGLDTLRAIHEIARDVPIVLTSGYPEQEAARLSGGRFLQKPFALSALVATMNDALAAEITEETEGTD